MPRKLPRTIANTNIYRRGEQYQVRIRKANTKATKVFDDLESARAWRDSMLAKISAGTGRSIVHARNLKVSSLLHDYAESELPAKSKRDGDPWQGLNKTDRYDIQKLLGEHGDVSLQDLTPARLATYRDNRLTEVSAHQVRHELALLSRIIRWHTRERGLRLPDGNPMSYVALPELPPGRERRLLTFGDAPEDSEEWWLLEEALRPGKSLDTHDCIIIALETGMRAGEIIGLRHGHINWHYHTALLPKTKNGTSREVPLSKKAFYVLKNRPSIKDKAGNVTNRFWKMTLGASLSTSFVRLKQAARKRYVAWCEEREVAPEPRMLTDFHFHDFRHEAAWRMTRYFQALELAKIFGWENVNQALTYYQPDVQEFARRLWVVDENGKADAEKPQTAA